MDPLEVLPILHLKNTDIYTREIDLGEKVLQKQDKSGWDLKI
jgi:hypothetical protein